MARHLFVLKARERIVVGISFGLLLHLTLANALANFLPVHAAFWGASLVILTAGLVAAWRSPRNLGLTEFRAWPILAVTSVVFLLFTAILRGLGIFDDYLHLPLVSVMAAGDIPPHFYANPERTFAYHYGLQVLAAAMVRIGGFLPWSGWDMARALALSLTGALAWLWVRRIARNSWASFAGAMLAIFGGGSRWLLLFLPSSWLSRLGANLELQPSLLLAGPDFYAAMPSPWPVDGGGPLQLPFAFADGIYVPLNYLLGSTGALPALTVLVILLLASRRGMRTSQAIVYGLLLAGLALSAEHLFVLVLAALGITLGVRLLMRRRGKTPAFKEPLGPWIAALMLSIPLSLVQGGFLTESARAYVSALLGQVETLTTNAYGFSLRWPPGLMSGHLGPLSLLDPGQALMLLAELGPALLLGPLVACAWLVRRAGRLHWPVILTWASMVSLLFPVFVRYGVDRSTTRFPATALWMWTVLGLPALWLFLQSRGPWWRAGAAAGFFASVLGGWVMFSVELSAVPHPQISYFIAPEESLISLRNWDRLEEGALVLDSLPERAVTLLGRATRARADIYAPLAEWETLVAAADPRRIAQAGFRYVYLDNLWWGRMTSEQREAFRQTCVRTMDSVEIGTTGFRRLLDVIDCR
jgi:hypothetical protein